MDLFSIPMPRYGACSQKVAKSFRVQSRGTARQDKWRDSDSFTWSARYVALLFAMLMRSFNPYPSKCQCLCGRATKTKMQWPHPSEPTPLGQWFWFFGNPWNLNFLFSLLCAMLVRSVLQCDHSVSTMSVLECCQNNNLCARVLPKRKHIVGFL